MQSSRSIVQTSGSPTNSGTLYERTGSGGTLVRIRRTTDQGVTPVIAVLEQLSCTSNGSGAGSVGGGPPDADCLSLLEVMAQTELDAILLLEPYARSEAAVTRLAKARQS